MMSSLRVVAPAALALSLALLAVLPGCGPSARLELRSFRDPYFPETVRASLDRCAFSRDRNGDFHVAGSAADARLGEYEGVQQHLYVHIFWRPIPGRTFDDPSGCDATLTYVIQTATGTAVFEGTGFVYAKPPKSGDLGAAIEKARLRLTRRTGDIPEILGDLRLTGTLNAKRDANLATDLRGELERHAAKAGSLALDR